MKWANHLEAAKHRIATNTSEVLAAADIAFCLVAATAPIEPKDITCSATSSALRLLYARLQLLQFTTCDLYLQESIANSFIWIMKLKITKMNFDESKLFGLCISYLSISCSFGGVGGSAPLNLPPQLIWPPEYVFNHLLKATTWASDFVGTKQAFCQLVGPTSIILRSCEKQQHKTGL